MLNQIKNWWANRQQLDRQKKAAAIAKKKAKQQRSKPSGSMKGSQVEAVERPRRRPRPKNNRAILRHLRRILTLREVLAESGDDMAFGKRRRIHKEINERTEKLNEVGITVPSRDDELRQLIAEYENG